MAAVLLVCASVSVAPPQAVSAAPADDTTPTVPNDQVLSDAGDVKLVDVDGDIVNSGDGNTPFFVVVPDAAACPGDSANDQWRAQSFLVPETDDVLSLWFGSTGPEPPWEASRYPMFENQNGLPMSQMMLRRNAAAGSPGVIEQSGETSLRVHAENQIIDGRYRIGVACAYFRQTTQYWDLVVEITSKGDMDPSHLQWKVVEAPGAAVPDAPANRDGLLSRALVVFGVLILLAVAASARRSRQSPPASP